MSTQEPDIHASCKRQIAGLKSTINFQNKLLADQARLLEQQSKRLERLEQRLALDSTNSHLPPSKDSPVSKAKRKSKKPSKRKQGAQPGHKGTKRTLLPPDQVNHFVAHLPESCHGCGSSLRNKPNELDPAPLLHQVMDLPPDLIEVTEHQLHARLCFSCGEVTRAELPAMVPKICSGPRLQAFTALLTAHFRCSKRSAQQFYQLIFGHRARISLGTICNHEKRTSKALAEPYKELVGALAGQKLIHCDETSWPEKNIERYLWTAVASHKPWTAFKIDRRTREAFSSFLKGFSGTAHVDRYGSYAHLKEQRCFCWAHLKRDFEQVLERGGDSARVGKAGLRAHKKLFKIWHRFKGGEIDRNQLQARLEPLKEQLRKALIRGDRSQHKKTRSFCRNLLADWACLWRFAEIEGAEPTNNAAEQAVRPAVILRKTSFGTQSRAGSRFLERMLSVIESCRRQGRNVLEYVTQACRSALTGRKWPSLLGTERGEVAAPT